MANTDDNTYDDPDRGAPQRAVSYTHLDVYKRQVPELHHRYDCG